LHGRGGGSGVRGVRMLVTVLAVTGSGGDRVGGVGEFAGGLSRKGRKGRSGKEERKRRQARRRKGKTYKSETLNVLQPFHEVQHRPNPHDLREQVQDAIRDRLRRDSDDVPSFAARPNDRVHEPKAAEDESGTDEGATDVVAHAERGETGGPEEGVPEVCCVVSRSDKKEERDGW
jgi:hypothetical protein